jgi:BACON domain-containing protein
MVKAISVLAALAVLAPLGAFAQRTEIEFITEELPWAVIDKGYSPAPLEVRVSGMCPLGGIGYSVVSGALPPGVQLSRLGYFSGTPVRNGTFDFIIRAANGCAWTGKRFSIVVTGAAVFSVTPAKLEFDYTTGADAPVEQVVHISATWPNLPYQVTVSSADWLKASPDHGFTPRAGSALAEDQVRVRVDASRLKPGHYSGTITISAWQALYAPSIGVELIVN